MPQILINREPLKHLNFDVELLGDCDTIVNELCHRLGDGWNAICTSVLSSIEIPRDEMVTPVHSGGGSPQRETVSNDNSTKNPQPSVVSPSQSVDQYSLKQETMKTCGTLDDKVTSSTSCSSLVLQHSVGCDLNSGCSCFTENISVNSSCTEPKKPKTESKSGTNSDTTALHGDFEAKAVGTGVNDTPSFELSREIMERQACNTEKGKCISGIFSGKQDVCSLGNKDTGSHGNQVENSHGSQEERELPGHHVSDDRQLAMLRTSWKPKLVNLASRLPG